MVLSSGAGISDGIIAVYEVLNRGGLKRIRRSVKTIFGCTLLVPIPIKMLGKVTYANCICFWRPPAVDFNECFMAWSSLSHS